MKLQLLNLLHFKAVIQQVCHPARHLQRETENRPLSPLFSTPVIKGFGAGWFVGEIYNDFHDMTRPNDIFMAGLRLAKDKGWTYYD